MRALFCSVLLLFPILAGCAGTPKPVDEGARKPYGLLQHPIIDAAAEELVSGAHSAIAAKLAPNVGDRWMIPPIVGEEGAWEASALSFAIAALDGRVRPVQPTQRLQSVPSVQAWLRDQNLPNAIWIVEASGVIRPELQLVICTGEMVWRSSVITVSVPKDERFTWPFDPKENSPLARIEVGEAEALLVVDADAYVQSREGLRKIEYSRRSKELSLDALQPWEDFGRTWITRNVGSPPDRTPSAAVMRRDIRLEIHDADIPRGEGELVGWYLSRSGPGTQLPLQRSSDIELLGVAGTPYGWDIPDTWLILRAPPAGAAYLEMFSVTMRLIPPPRRTDAPQTPEPVIVLSDLIAPLGVPAFDDRMAETHRLNPAGQKGDIAVYDPLYGFLSVLELRLLDPTQLSDLRTARGNDGVGVVRFSAVDGEYPLWRGASAKKKLADGDRARWREHRAAALWGVALLDPSMPEAQRKALAAQLAQLTPLQLFGESRAGILPTLPITGQVPASGPVPAKMDAAAALWLTPSGTSEMKLGLPADGAQPLLERLSLLLQDAGAQIKGVAGSALDDTPDAAYSVRITRMRVPGATPTERALALAADLGLEKTWPGGVPDLGVVPDPAFATNFQSWLLEQGYMIPLWYEPGIVFIDRRLMDIRSDSTMVLPDLREAHWLPESELQRLRPQQ